jgi:predicted metalloprotease
MRWGDMRESRNVEDRTGMGAPRGGGFPLGGGFKLGGGALILVVIASLIFGINPLEILGLLGGGAPPMQPQVQQQAAPPPGYGPQTAAPSPEKTFSAKVLGDTEDVWSALFQAMGSRYDPPKLVLYRDAVRSGCGVAPSAAGPFYCPADRTLNLDTSFFEELSRKFGAPGDFAQAYVIAHEVGHHVQNLFGTMRQFDAQSQRVDERTRNALSVRLELQADCYAGVWGYFARKRNLLEPGDLEEGLRAAAAVGDDQIQKRTRGYVVKESFTHGSAQQRMHWFRVGLESGDPRNCNTFEQRSP